MLFKVICVNSKDLKPAHPKISEGITYTVEDIERYDGDDYYILEEIKQLATDGCRFNYCHERFIRISNISETEFVRNYQKEKV